MHRAIKKNGKQQDNGRSVLAAKRDPRKTTSADSLECQSSSDRPWHAQWTKQTCRQEWSSTVSPRLPQRILLSRRNSQRDHRATLRHLKRPCASTCRTHAIVDVSAERKPRASPPHSWLRSLSRPPTRHATPRSDCPCGDRSPSDSLWPRMRRHQISPNRHERTTEKRADPVSSESFLHVGSDPDRFSSVTRSSSRHNKPAALFTQRFRQQSWLKNGCEVCNSKSGT